MSEGGGKGVRGMDGYGMYVKDDCSTHMEVGDGNGIVMCGKGSMKKFGDVHRQT